MATATDEIYVKIITETNEAIKGMSGFTNAIGETFLKYFALIKLLEEGKKIFREAVKSYIDSERALARLDFSLQLTGQYTRQASTDLETMASSLAMHTTYSKEASEAAAGLLIQIGNLTTEGVQKAIPLLQDYATAIGVDLSTAAEQFTAAMEGGRNMFQKYGIDLQGVQDPTQRFDILIQGLTEHFGGMADAMGKKAGGAIEIFKNQINELLGSIAAPALGPFTELLKMINSTTAIKKVFEADIDSASIATLKEYQTILTDQLELLKAHPGFNLVTIYDTKATMQQLAAVTEAIRRLPKEAGSNILDQGLGAVGQIPIPGVMPYSPIGGGGGQYEENFLSMPSFRPNGQMSIPSGAPTRGGEGNLSGMEQFANAMKVGLTPTGQYAMAVKEVDVNILSLEKDVGTALTGNLGSLFTALGAAAVSGKGSEAAFQSWVSSLMDEIGNMMIVAGLRMMIEGDVWIGLAIAAAGGLTSLIGGAVGATPSPSQGGALPATASNAPQFSTTYTTPSNKSLNIYVAGSVTTDRDLARTIASVQADW